MPLYTVYFEIFEDTYVIQFFKEILLLTFKVIFKYNYYLVKACISFYIDRSQYSTSDFIERIIFSCRIF